MKITLLTFAMAMALVAAPVLAADMVPDQMVPDQFAAINSIASDVTPLSDEQLATVEGGFHLNLAFGLIEAAAVWATPAPPFNNTIAQILQTAAIGVLTVQPAHFCAVLANC
jgi:hypothetical protein